jgi:hypothetical protein
MRSRISSGPHFLPPGLPRFTCKQKEKRRGWDSNPRDGFKPSTRFPVAILTFQPVLPFPLNRPFCRVFRGLPRKVCPLRTSLYHPGCSMVAVNPSECLTRLLDHSGLPLLLGSGSGRSHKETCAGCIVSLTTPTRSSLKASRSVSSLSLVEKAFSVFAESYFLR